MITKGYVVKRKNSPTVTLKSANSTTSITWNKEVTEKINAFRVSKVKKNNFLFIPFFKTNNYFLLSKILLQNPFYEKFICKIVFLKKYYLLY